MVWLILGVALWSWSHLLKRISPAWRASLGDGPAKGLVAVASLVAIGLMIYGFGRADTVQLWNPPEFMRHLNNLLMVAAVLLVNLGMSRGVLRTWMRHPMLTAVILWALAHLAVNGDLAAVILFGGLLAWAVVDMIMINRMEPAWVPPAQGPVINDVIYGALSAVLFCIIVYIHGWLGYPVLG